MPPISPYSTALMLGKARPTHITDDDDLSRVTAYETYEDIYHNVPLAFKVVMRDDTGEEMSRRLVPAARTIVEATNRYLANGLTWVPGETSTATPEVFAETMNTLHALFSREEFLPKWYSLKRWMLIKGDQLLHITVDASKAEGERLSITEVDPGQYFPIFDAFNAERRVGAYVITLVPAHSDTDDLVAQRLEYQRILTPEDSAQFGAPIGTIWTRLTFWEVDGWDDRGDEELKPVEVPDYAATDGNAALLAGYSLPPTITAIPLYHFRNNRRGGEPFGTSEVQGLETLLAGINQAASDADLAVALMGLGMYATDSGAPTDENGDRMDWYVAPAAVWELEDGKKLQRIDGLTTVQPVEDHQSMLENKAREASGTADVAVGHVDVKVAQSGVALAIQFAPITAKNAEKELELKSKLDQFLYDLLNGWLPAYEGMTPALSAGVSVVAEFGDALPVDRDATIKEVIALAGAGLISGDYARQILTKKLGMVFPSTIGADIVAEAGAALDATGVRLDAAVGGSATGVNDFGGAA